MTNTNTKVTMTTHTLAMLAALLPSAALADIGAIKVSCGGNCNGVTLGQACDTFVQFSSPTAVACENVAQPGGGVQVGCGAADCRPFGDLVRADLLGSYCQTNGAGQDVVVMCDDSPSLAAPALGAEDDQKHTPEP